MNQSMTWVEFLKKLSDLKKQGGKTGFNMGVLTRLIFADAFRSMIKNNPEYMSMPAVPRCQRMTAEVAAILKSKAKLGKSSKNEPIGIEDIKNDATLVLWRRLVNPIFTHNLAAMYGKHLNQAMGFQWIADRDIAKKTPMVLNLPNKPGCDLYARWEDVFTNEASYKLYTNGLRRAAVMGIVTKTSPLKTKTGKTALTISFFDGFDEYTIKLWAEKDTNKYSQAKAAYLKPSAIGLFLIKPNLYNGQPDGNLIHFYEMST